jgi:hypothetical protein
MNTQSHLYEKVYQFPFRSSKEILEPMSCEELKELLIKAGDYKGLEALLGFSRYSFYKYLRAKLKECFYTASEYARAKGKPVSTVFDHLRQGKIKSFRYSGKYYIPRKE